VAYRSLLPPDDDERPSEAYRRRVRARRVDLILGVAIAAAQVGFTYLAGRHQDPGREYDLWAAVLLAASGLSLVVRRRWPVPVLLTAFTTTLTYWTFDYPRGPVFGGLLVAFVTAVWAGHRRVAWPLVAVGYLAFLWLGPLLDQRPHPDVGEQVGLGTWLIALVTLSELTRAHRQRRGEDARRRASEQRRRADEERLRIARELHDVLAHNISLISVQSGVALHLIDDQPEQARVALEAIRQASKEALGELRHVLGVLRGAGEDAAPRAPGGLDGLDDLVARAAAAGLPVRVERAGRVDRDVPAAVDLAGFRIVQEALTNTLRHAGAGPGSVRSTVLLRYGDDALTVRIDDDGRSVPGRPGADGGTGTGIVGMRERAATVGGELWAGPRAGGGFRVEARLPLPDGAGAGP
jgi:signal transduction histidine kinase